LTAIGNRRAFEYALREAMEKASASKTNLSIVMLDIDHFKRVNDTYGHGGGDEILKKFARLLDKAAREQDTVSRFGGEEFALILPELEI
jgi:diguanylate cyclase (GGDEF)-like protein